VNFSSFYDSGKGLQNLQSRNNNFLELRLLASISVAVSHSSYFFFPNYLPHYFHILSDNSVFVFFLISGFLITKSARSGSVNQFFLNRIRRVFPALTLNLIAISFIFAPLISRSTQKHLQVSDQFLYFIKGLTLVPSWQISIGDSLSNSKVSTGWNNPL
jgi:peptidoglycan/LPS O-acetylase OafA/YrhL